MGLFIYLSEYVLFMHWLETAHPELFVRYGDKIGFPVDEKGVQIQYWLLSSQEIALLDNVKAGYYQSQPFCVDTMKAGKLN